jgi:hypothetical protein
MTVDRRLHDRRISNEETFQMRVINVRRDRHLMCRIGICSYGSLLYGRGRASDRRPIASSKPPSTRSSPRSQMTAPPPKGSLLSRIKATAFATASCERQIRDCSLLKRDGLAAAPARAIRARYQLAQNRSWRIRHHRFRCRRKHTARVAREPLRLTPLPAHDRDDRPRHYADEYATNTRSTSPGNATRPRFQ